MLRYQGERRHNLLVVDELILLKNASDFEFELKGLPQFFHLILPWLWRTDIYFLVNFLNLNRFWVLAQIDDRVLTVVIDCIVD